MSLPLLFHFKTIAARHFRGGGGGVSLRGSLCGLLAPRGECVVYLRGGVSIHLKPGDLFLLPGGSRAVFNDESAYDLILLRYRGPLRAPCARSYEDAVAWLLKETLHSVIRVRAADVRPAFARLVVGAPLWDQAQLASKVILLLLNVLHGERQRKEPPASPAFGERYLISLVKDYLYKHHSRKVTLDEIAWQVQVSGGHLARIFRSHEGITVFEALRRIRISEARRLLLETDATLETIAESTGFTSVSLFCRTFKNLLNCTPTQYRLNTGPALSARERR